jgi:hypothetical protein
MLTAFVATALAHSEKTHALDWLHAVEAQWGHSKAALLGEIKHIKTGWLDTLQTLWKLPLHDEKVAHESSKEGQALTLVSLIAIAMSALQPIVEKISVLAQFVADELPGHGGAGQAQISHTTQFSLDGPSGVGTGPVTYGNESGHAHSDAADSPQAHKVMGQPTPTDGGGDGQKAVIDATSAHAMTTIPTVQKVALSTDDASHVPAAAIEAQPEVAENSCYCGSVADRDYRHYDRGVEQHAIGDRYRRCDASGPPGSQHQWQTGADWLLGL